jgi:molybdopterin molybdotransferase
MLSYDEALARVLDSVPGPLPTESVALEDALGRVLAENVIAEGDLPPFDNSAVDGYAVDGSAPSGKNERGVYQRSHEIKAGATEPKPISGNWVAEIYTGAPIPEGADRVVMLEDAEPLDDKILLKELGEPGDHIRRRGSDVAKGTVALGAGTVVGPAEIGLLASLNREYVPCARLPLVGLLTTGDELIPVGARPLRLGEIRDSNGPALAAALTEAGAVVVHRRHVRDDRQAVEDALDACAGCDVIVTSGGVSVGAFDYVKAALEARGALDFWRIAIKPGKPLAFGRLGDALFFGLPGNPVSSLVTFELFVRPVLRKLSGRRDMTRPVVSAVLAAPLSHESGRREFVRAFLAWQGDHYIATPTGAQGSHRLSSLTGADAYLVAQEDHGDYVAGECLPAMLLF